jgi:hypothetical protein
MIAVNRGKEVARNHTASWASFPKKARSMLTSDSVTITGSVANQADPSASYWVVLNP